VSGRSAALIAAIVLAAPIAAPRAESARATNSRVQASAGALVNIDKGTQSNVDEGRQVTIRTAGEWTRLWQQHNPERPIPAIDFSTQMVVGVFMGSRSTAGFAVEIVSVTEAPDGLTVRYRNTTPPRGAITAQVITSPYHLVAVPKAAGTVTFELLRD
jgi:PrcB C-terminal